MKCRCCKGNLPQYKDIDAPLFNKIERGKRHAKHEQVIAIAKNFKVNRNDFLSHWLAEQVTAVIIVNKALNIAKKALNIAKKRHIMKIISYGINYKIKIKKHWRVLC
jgi:hypothetical protein